MDRRRLRCYCGTGEAWPDIFECVGLSLYENLICLFLFLFPSGLVTLMSFWRVTVHSGCGS